MEAAAIDQSNSQRVFYSLLLRVGALGKYQYICLVIWGILYMVSSSSVYFIPYLFYQTPYVCKDLNQSQCLSHVCSLPYQLRYQFTQGSKRTLINKFGDFRCQQSQINQLQLIIYLSAVFGVIAGAYLNTFLRKKLLVETSLIISILCFIGIVFTNSFTFLVVLLCLNLALQSVIQQLLLCFITQQVLQQERGKHTMILFVFYSAGCIFNGLLFKIFQWEYVLMFYFLGLLGLTLIGLKLYIKQTPFDLITNFTPEAAYKSLRWIAQQNGNLEMHNITVSELKSIKEQYQQHMKEKQKQQFSILDLFRFQSLRMNVIVCFVIHLLIFYNYCAPILALDQFSSDIYINGMVFSSASVVSAIFCYFTINDLARKKMINYTTIASLIFILPLYITSKCQSDCSSQFKWLETLSIFTFRVIVQVSYQAYYFIQNQIFPTQIRALAILVTGGACTVSKLLVPFVSTLNQSNSLVLPLSFILSGVLVIISMSQIKETVGIPPPQIIEELAYKHKE